MELTGTPPKHLRVRILARTASLVLKAEDSCYKPVSPESAFEALQESDIFLPSLSSLCLHLDFFFFCASTPVMLAFLPSPTTPEDSHLRTFACAVRAAWQALPLRIPHNLAFEPMSPSPEAFPHRPL